MSEQYADLRAEMHDAVATVLQRHDQASMLNRCVVLAEIIDIDGERVLWQIASEGVKTWDTLGMLEHARIAEQVAAHQQDE